jgi:flagella basal body P-ring formation protein FlgA
MRNISSWVWITMVAVFMLGSGLVGTFGLPSLGRAWSAMEKSFSADSGTVAAVPVIQQPQSRPTMEVPAPAAPAAPAPSTDVAQNTDAAAITEDVPAPAATPEAVAEAVAWAETAAEPLPQTAAAAPPPQTAPEKSTLQTAPLAKTAAPAVRSGALAPVPMTTVPLQAPQPVAPISEPKGVSLPKVVVKTPRSMPSPANKSGVRVTLRPEVKIGGERVMLSDVATLVAPKGVHLPDPTTVEVGTIASAAVRSSLITRPIVRQALIREGVDMKDAEFEGPNATRIVPLRNVVKSAVLMRAAQNFLAGELAAQGWQKSDLQVRPVQDVPDMVVPDGKVAIETSRIDNRRPVGMVLVNLDVRVGDQIIKSVRASFQVQVSGRVVTLRHMVEKDSLIAATDIEVTRRDISTLPDGAVRDPSQALGKMALLTLRPGTVLIDSMAGIQPTVARNSIVTIHFRGEKVSLTMNGKALKDGQKGDTIPVRNVDTGKMMDAVVIDKNNVDVSGAPTAPASVTQDIVPAGVGAFATKAGLPMVPPSAGFSEMDMPPRTVQPANAPKLPPPNYVKRPATPTPTLKSAPGPTVQAAVRSLKQEIAAPMFDMRSKALPLR